MNRIIRMKSILIISFVVAISAVTALNFHGFDFPNVELHQDEREAGMPYLHKPAKELLG